MRQIKFRAWDKENKKMYVDELESISFAKSGVPANASIAGFSKPLQAVGKNQQIILMQFTGLLDKNGREIYEGDVVAVSYGAGRKQVKWNESACCWNVQMSAGKTEHLDVIGNIYENPDLLK